MLVKMATAAWRICTSDQHTTLGKNLWTSSFEVEVVPH